MLAIKRWWPLIFLLCTISSAAQDALRKKVSLPSTLTTAGDLRKEVSRQTGLQFTFSSHTIRPEQTIRLPKPTLSAKELLDAMQHQLQAEYKVYEDHVIFTKKKKTTASRDDGFVQTATSGNAKPEADRSRKHATPTVKTSTQHKPLPASASNSHLQDRQSIKNGLNDASENQLLSETGSAKAAPATTPATDGSISGESNQGKNGDNPYSPKPGDPETRIHQPIVLPDAARTVNDHLRSLADDRLRARAYRLTLTSPGKQAGITSSPAQQPIRAQRDRFSRHTPIFSRYTTAGVEVNETFPANILIKGGIPLLHGIVGWSAASRHSSWRFGGGTRWSLNETWHLQANFTTGKVKDKLQQDSLGMISRTVRITETLHRIGVYAERNFGKRWSAVAGVSWNMLNRTNTYEGTRIGPGERIFSDFVPKEGYRALKPLYTISSSFNESAKAWKDRWIGTQVGVYYRF
ncbi:hypothetical protein WJU16_17590 [Chitinophaga pollutisoli]|uniref:Uncharacterized protein n=1 Tax=Chitinophaga pollutisoli TaxID=3133966 RepID=A0ABZ2YK59_9BACT